jgi:hypothetical protein
VARTQGRALVGAQAPQLVRVSLSHAARPRGWGRQRGGFAMHRAGTLSLRFAIPRAGVWELWLQGQFMARVSVAVDGRALGSIEGQLAGNSLVPDTATPFAVRLAAGAHSLTVTRAGFSLAPGAGGSAVLAAAFLSPAGTPARELRRLADRAGARALCGRRYEWVEVVSR